MTLKDAFKKDFLRFDAEGNRISTRELPDGSVCEVIKNFPDETELRRTLADHGSDVCYTEFASLERWMVSYRAK